MSDDDGVGMYNHGYFPLHCHYDLVTPMENGDGNRTMSKVTGKQDY